MTGSLQVFKTLWELTNEQIMVTREVYQEKFGQDLKEVLNKFTSGPFQLLTLMVVDKLRVEFGQLSVRIDGGYKLYKTQTPTPVSPPPHTHRHSVAATSHNRHALAS